MKKTDRQKIEAVWEAWGVEVRREREASYAVGRCWLWNERGALVKVVKETDDGE